MPLFGQLSIDRLQTIVLAHLPSSTIGAATSPVSAVDSGFPFMPFIASPPDLFIRVGGDIPWG